MTRPSTKLGAPFLERRHADAMLPAQLRGWATGPALLEDGDDLAV